MASENQDDGSVEVKPISAELSNLYERASNDDMNVAKSIGSPHYSAHVTIVTISETARKVISSVEALYSEDGAIEKRKYRPPKSSRFKTALVVFFPGVTDVGYPFMTVIPFYVSGNATIEGECINEKYYYNAFGNCKLKVDEGGKVGAWVISDVRQ